MTLALALADTAPPTHCVDKEPKLERSGDIRSFFAATTAPRIQDSKTPPSSGSPGDTARCSSPVSRSSRGRPPQNSLKSHQGRAMSQLLLDISNRPSTQICKACGMSFVIGVPEDAELHKKHHKRVVDGVEWSPHNESPQSECRVVWRSHRGMDEDRIVKVSLDPQSLKKSKYKHKVAQILEMVNCSLDAQELTRDQLCASSLYLYVGSPAPAACTQPMMSKKRKRNASAPKVKKESLVVKAMCVAARIEHAYQIVRGPNGPEGADDDQCLDELLRFGDTTSELYCSRKPEDSLIGIHRVWTSPNYRRAGLARLLLDSVATTFIYGMPIARLEDRLRLVAFSQPTESGMHLASQWLQTILFKIFLD